MSLRDFKETLASLPFSQPITEETFQQDRHRQSRKPPKSSLKEQLALLELHTVDLDAEFHSQITTSQSPTTSYREESRLTPSRCSGYAERLASRPSPEPSRYRDAISDGNASINRPTKRIKRLEQDAYSIIDKATDSGVSSFETTPKTLSRTPRKTRLSDYAPALLSEPTIPGCQREFELENVTQGLEQRKVKKDTSILQEESDCVEKEDEFTQNRLSGDSEAGLFIQPQIASFAEPLILWPQNGEGSEVSENDLVQVPSSINMRLMDHQREGVKFLFNLYRENKGGILGDDMGLGKTIQVIAFVSAILKIDRPNLCPEKHVLILCPTSVLRNWEQEFHAWGSFKVAIYHGIHRETVLRGLEAENLQIVLTSFDTFRIHGECLCLIDWDCMVVDEAHRIKNDKSDLYKMCTKVQTKRRYGLTGTIMQNKILDLFNVFDWAIPGCLGTREHFKEFYEEPLKQGQRISAPERFVKIAGERKAHLGRVLKKYLIRREKHDTIGHLMMGKEDNVIFCEMSPLQKKVYRRLLNSPDFQCLIKKDERCTCGSPLTYKECCYRIVTNGLIWPHLHKDSTDGCDSCPYCLVLPCLTKLQQVSNHIELIKPNPKDDKEKQKRDQMLSEYVLAEDAGLVGGVTQNESFLGLSDSKHCGKMKALEILLAHWLQEGDKVLLFSYSVRMLDILDKFMIRKGYCFSRLDGSTPMNMRQSLVDDFNRSPSKQVFLISTRAGGLGLNLVSANRVVIFDPNWNPSQDLQAQDRSFRFGQRRHVTVYRLLAAGSLEELVYTRQIYKQQLFNIAVSGNLEKRYFEGVQDSKCNQGELFGIGNLFKDLTEKAFTSEIIENHAERAMKFCGDKKSDKGILTQVDDPEDPENNVSDNGKPGFENLQCEDKLTRILKNAGVVYAHRNEDVVNLKLKPKNASSNSVEVGCKDSKGTDVGLPSDIPSREPKFLQESTKRSGEMRKESIEQAASVEKGIAEVKKKSRKQTTGQANVTAELIIESIKQSEQKPICSKEVQFLSLAKFKGMEKIQFCKWLLSISKQRGRSYWLITNK